jgi:hypothetical protein
VPPKTDALDSVLKASAAEARLDVWVTSRDEAQALLYVDDCRDWAKLLNLLATYEGKLLLDKKKNCSAHVLQFANGRRIYCLSSNPNALAGKRGHVKIDEFALHPDQRGHPGPTPPLVAMRRQWIETYLRRKSTCQVTEKQRRTYNSVTKKFTPRRKK